MHPIAVTVTTIHVPKVIAALEENRRLFRHDAVQYVVVSDKKTPDTAADYCRSLRDEGVACEYLDLGSQDAFLEKSPALKAYLPYNSFARRNIGDLWAYLEGAEIIIRIDDDNFPVAEHDFFGGHKIVGSTQEFRTVASSNGWFNCCQLLDARKREFYPRGFPYPQRWQPHELQWSVTKRRVLLNAGLWSGEPDVDAVTRLCEPVQVTGLKPQGGPLLLEKATWCPINTQNTAFHRDLIPAAFVSPGVGRYDDIFSGYLLRCLMDHFGDGVCYGLPIVHQDRNDHNLWNDLKLEMFGNEYTPHLLGVLREFVPQSRTYAAAYGELAAYLRKSLTQGRDGFQVLLDGMTIWANLFV
jgi:hypothetical protein